MDKSYGKRMITVLYDPDKRELLGRKGEWVSMERFAKDPPQKPEDMKPETEKPPVTVDGDPGGYPICIDHVLYYCLGTMCWSTGKPC